MPELSVALNVTRLVARANARGEQAQPGLDAGNHRRHRVLNSDLGAEELSLDRVAGPEAAYGRAPLPAAGVDRHRRGGALHDGAVRRVGPRQGDGLVDGSRGPPVVLVSGDVADGAPLVVAGEREGVGAERRHDERGVRVRVQPGSGVELTQVDGVVGDPRAWRRKKRERCRRRGGVRRAGLKCGDEHIAGTGADRVGREEGDVSTRRRDRLRPRVVAVEVRAELAGVDVVGARVRRGGQQRAGADHGRQKRAPIQRSPSSACSCRARRDSCRWDAGGCGT